jgi:heterodisulfide reductase subunit A
MEKGPVEGLLVSSLPDNNFGDVMVVGGGIDSGYKVYMVEKSPAIGGHMAQLDKTYPTNDCSM